MRKSLQELHDKVAGRDVFIIGGGPSFNLIDKSLLDDKLVVCINSAYKEFSNATMLYWCDESWACNHLDNLDKHPCKLRFTGRHTADNYIAKDLRGTGGAAVVKRTGDFGLDCDPNHIKGNNSGAQVINLLANMKVHRMILLGYDMNMKNGKTHWHGGHGLAMSPHIYSDLFIPSVASMAPGLKNLGVDVVNCSEGSALECFRKQRLEDFLKENYIQ
jgi:hypothetical protein